MAAERMGRKPIQKKKEEEPKYLCPYCNKEKKKSEFYMSSDPLIMTGVTHMCKTCAGKIARNYDERTKTYGDCTKASIQEALERLDKPFINSIFESSYFELNNPKALKKRSNIWDAYIKNISMKQYNTMRWRDGDVFETFKAKAEASVIPIEQQIMNNVAPKNQEIYEYYQKNRNDVVHLLGYDPFESEAEEDKPLLYSQLIGYLDLSGDNDDMMRTSSAITIVRGFLQQAKIDDRLAKCMSNISSGNSAGEIKSLLDSKQKVSSTISQLAEQSCLSLKHNKQVSKGENTWTGKIKKLKELNLREAEVNGFDIGTCKGMQQVLELSDASILKQLRLDESEWSDMVAEQREMITAITNEKNTYQEINRILLRENLDLRDALDEHNLLEKDNLKDLKELFSIFGDVEEVDENLENGTSEDDSLDNAASDGESNE